MTVRGLLRRWQTEWARHGVPWSRASRQARAERTRDALINDPTAARVSAGALYLWSAIIVPLVFVTADHRPMLGIVAALVFEVVYVVLVRMSVRELGTPRLRAALLLLLLGIAVGVGIGYGGAWLQLFTLTSMAAAVALPQSAPALGGVLAITVILAVVGRQAPNLGSVITGTLVSGFIIWLVRRLLDAIGMLQRARQELAMSAVAAERLRFARDLHDLLGHTLSLIVVKSEVVRRVARADPEAAAREAADIEAVGRTALAEIRQAVSGYREEGLAAELEQAQRSLAAAGITAVVRTSGAPYPREADSVLGWVVREGATNVIRHSHARRCEIDVRRDGAEIVATIADDGVGGSTDDQPGNGLSGLAERALAIGGRLEVRPRRWRGFQLEVAVPVGQGGEA